MSNNKILSLAAWIAKTSPERLSNRICGIMSQSRQCCDTDGKRKPIFTDAYLRKLDYAFASVATR